MRLLMIEIMLFGVKRNEVMEIKVVCDIIVIYTAYFQRVLDSSFTP